MKKIIQHITLAALILTLACSKGIVDRTANTAALSPLNNDVNAGTWKPVLLNAPVDLAV
jgi:hypothetical protein